MRWGVKNFDAPLRRGELWSKANVLSPELLIGAWTLVDWTIRRSDGRTSRPLQPNPGGMLLYTPDGAMSVVMHCGDRAAFSSDDIRRETDASKAAAFASYFHYSGRWKIRGDEVVHHVTAALNPNLVGTDQVRRAELAGDFLTLSATEPLSNGMVRALRLVWRRLDSK